MSKSLQKRKFLFTKFSNQLLLLKHAGIINWDFKYEKPYLCPICLEEFTDIHLEDNSKNNFLTLEDAPPNSLGGYKIALTCKKCNSSCGHKIDFHLTAMLRYIDESYFYKDSKHFRQIEYEGKLINVELVSNGNGALTAYHRTKLNDPSILDKFIYSLKNRTIQPILNLAPSKINFEDQRINFALVKTNYIVTFAKFGYIFLLDKQYNCIRQQLLNPDQNIYPWTPFIKDQFPADAVGTYYIMNKGIESILNVFALTTEYSQTIIGGTLQLPQINIEEYSKRIDALKSPTNKIKIDNRKYDPNADLFNDINQIRKILNWIKATK